MKKWILAITGALFGLFALLIAGFFVAAESDEVVVLALPDGSQQRLWVVDHNGHAWLRRGDGKGWITRIQDQPTLEVTRAGVSKSFRFELITAGADRDRVNDLTLQKYGLAEQYLRALGLDPKQATAVKLIPVSP